MLSVVKEFVGGVMSLTGITLWTKYTHSYSNPTEFTILIIGGLLFLLGIRLYVLMER